MFAKAHLVSVAPLPQTKVNTERMILIAGQSQQLSCRPLWVRVLSGEAWISFKGEDIVLGTGEWVNLEKDRHPAVLSSAKFATGGRVEVEVYWEA
jgi:hypothetical protein